VSRQAVERRWVERLSEDASPCPQCGRQATGRWIQRESAKRVNAPYFLVTFSWKDRSDHNRRRELTLPGTEFVKRYLRHVLPKGLRSVRYSDFCHPAAWNPRGRNHFVPAGSIPGISPENCDPRVFFQPSFSVWNPLPIIETTPAGTIQPASSQENTPTAFQTLSKTQTQLP
jgi:hypothetical protein